MLFNIQNPEKYLMLVVMKFRYVTDSPSQEAKDFINVQYDDMTVDYTG